MKLYLMQHGEAMLKEEDPERGLSVQGSKDVHKMADLLHLNGISVNRVLHSGKRRAQQTAEIISAKLAVSILEVSDNLNPNDDVDELIEEIDNRDEDILVVGHLPFLSRFVSCLVSDNIEQALLAYRPAGIVCLQRDATESWLINWMLIPELLLDASSSSK